MKAIGAIMIPIGLIGLFTGGSAAMPMWAIFLIVAFLLFSVGRFGDK